MAVGTPTIPLEQTFLVQKKKIARFCQSVNLS